MTPQDRTELQRLEAALKLARQAVAGKWEAIESCWGDRSALETVASALLSIAAEVEELRAENERLSRAEKLKPAPNHIHTNPSPSHAGSWFAMDTRLGFRKDPQSSPQDRTET